jgi:peptidoglycan/LPS O-acetylase OafA/YrhL
MNPSNPFFALAVFFIAYATAYLLNLKYRITNDTVRFEAIDGLRGFLGVGVYIHHSSVWFQYLKTESWESPNSNLFNQLGKTSVSFFFMITAFLFISKLLNTNNQKIDWNTLFISRFFRLVPMYLVSILVLVLIVFIISDWELNVSLVRFSKEMFAWGTFTFFGTPTINGSSFTSIINAGVVWSLPYEWLFYFGLPIISFLIHYQVTSKLYLIVSFLFILIFYKIHGLNEHHLFSFVGGALTPFLIKVNSKKINKINFNSIVITAIVLLCLALSLFFNTPNNYICKILIIIVFSLIALGNNVFGVLKSPVLKFLGEISYSIYLLHGIIIFIFMYFYFNLEQANNLTSEQFCISIFIITPIVVITSFISYKIVEKPFMNYSKKIAAKK